MSGEGFPVDNLLGFLEKSVRAVGNARRRSRNLQRKVESYDDIAGSLTQLITNRFGNQCSIHFYGSRVIGTSTFKSDIDIYVEWNSGYYRGTNVKKQREIMAFIARVFRSDDFRDFNLQKIPVYRATVPIIFCYYQQRRLRTELTFNDGIGVENSFLLAHFLDIQPKAVSLFHFLRVWFAIADMRFRNYQTLLLVVYFLQTQRLLPTMDRVQQGLRPHYIKGWNVAFNQSRTLRSYDCREMGFFLTHAIDFFEFYGEFDFGRNVIIPHLGQHVLRGNYARAVARFPGDPRQFKLDKPMAVTSLLTSDYNVFYNVGAERARKFSQLCQYSKGLLKNNK